MDFIQDARLCTAKEYDSKVENRLAPSSLVADDTLLLVCRFDDEVSAMKIPLFVVRNELQDKNELVLSKLETNNVASNISWIFEAVPEDLMVTQALCRVFFGERGFAITEAYGLSLFDEMINPLMSIGSDLK